MPILNSINQMHDEMKKWRQDLHQIPEIGLKEYKTSEYIRNKLEEYILLNFVGFGSHVAVRPTRAPRAMHSASAQRKSAWRTS